MFIIKFTLWVCNKRSRLTSVGQVSCQACLGKYQRGGNPAATSPTVHSTLHNVYFVKYDVTVSFLAQVLDTVTHFVSQVLDTAS